VALSTYAELQAAILSYLEQDDVSGQVDDFIRLAESRFNREASVQWMHKQATGDIDQQAVAVPTDLLEVVSMRNTSSSPAIVMDHVPSDRFFASNGASIGGGQPRYYTTLGTDFLFGPNPDGVVAGTYSYALEYLAAIPALGTGTPSNWLLDRAPDIYLYASLLEAQPFLLDDARLQVWAELYKQSLTSLQASSSRYTNRPGGVQRPERTTVDSRYWRV
jgi:hypothetical protein